MESDWAELPSDLLRQIMKKLDMTSMISFQYVCPNWQSTLSENPKLSLLRSVPSPPWLTIPPSPSLASLYYPADKTVYLCNQQRRHPSSLASFYSPTDRIVYMCTEKQWRPPPLHVARCVGSCHGWLAYIDYLCVIYLTNPFKHHDDESSIVKLPSIETLPCILGIDEVSSSRSCINFKYSDPLGDAAGIVPSTILHGSFISKLVMSTGPYEENCVVMVIYGIRKKIAFCKIGDTSWKTLDGKSSLYADLYYSSDNQCFYAVCDDDSWSIEVWKFRDSSMTCTHIETKRNEIYYDPSMTTDELVRSLCSTQKMYLLELNGDILLVIKYIGHITCHPFNDGDAYSIHDFPYKTFCFDVYKLDSDKKQWGLENCIGDEGDYTLFLGVNNAVACSVCDFPKLKRNSIYFTQDIYEYDTHKWRYDGSHDSGIFSFDDNSMHQCYHLSDHITPKQQNLTPMIWISPSLY